MEKEKFFEEMKKYEEKINIKFSVKQLDNFYKYMELLLEWNEKINLTAITDSQEIILKHFIDSITILKEINDNEKIVDVGTGAGFPGIPLSIMNETLDITLVDSLNKRLLFLEQVIKELDLKNVKTIHARAEEFGQNSKYRESFDVAVSRAVANMSTLSEYLIPLVKLDGRCIYMKGSNIDEEINESKKAIDILGGIIYNIYKFDLPNSDINRTLIVINKKNRTPKGYPRKPGTPAKLPLK